MAEALRAWVGSYAGEGVNHEGQAFRARLRLSPVLEGRGLQIDFRAEALTGQPFHEERSLLSRDLGGGWVLWSLCTNLPGACAHQLVAGPLPEGAAQAFIFEHGKPEEAGRFRERITLSLHPEGCLGYAFAWGLPGGAFEARSSVVMRPLGPA